MVGSGCGAVGRAVASNTGGPKFESSHRQLLLNIYLLLTFCRKDENKEKEAGDGPFFLKKKINDSYRSIFTAIFDLSHHHLKTKPQLMLFEEVHNCSINVIHVTKQSCT